MSNKLKISELSVAKKGEQLLAPVSLEIESSFFLSIVGNNGVGKSTFLRCLINQEEYQGKIESPFEPTAISYLPQQQELTFDLPVKEIVVMGLYSKLKLFQNYGAEHYNEVRELLKVLGIEDLYDRHFKELSGGQQQLVWLAQTLIKKPRLLILDEPTASLDVSNKVKVFKLLESLHLKDQLSIICATHDLYLLKRIKGKLLNLSAVKPEILDITDTTIDFFYELD